MKRIFDISLSILFLTLCALPMLCIALLIKFRLGSPVFFRQLRIGLDGELFSIIKFRSMDPITPYGDGFHSDEERLDSFGKWLRTTSLDELPELVNVVKGDMSLVGPRPLLPEYLSLYTTEQAKRHSVKPGITGLAQINGRNNQTWKERFDWDLRYIASQSLWLDTKILLLTFMKVFRREGIVPEGQTQMPKFDGTKN